MGHGFDVTGEQRVQKQRRQGEIVDAVHLGGDFHLLLVVAVNSMRISRPRLTPSSRRREMSLKVLGVMKQLVPASLAP